MKTLSIKCNTNYVFFSLSGHKSIYVCMETYIPASISLSYLGSVVTFVRMIHTTNQLQLRQLRNKQKVRCDNFEFDLCDIDWILTQTNRSTPIRTYYYLFLSVFWTLTNFAFVILTQKTQRQDSIYTKKWLKNQINHYRKTP